jgi:threonine dehydratase
MKSVKHSMRNVLVAVAILSCCALSVDIEKELPVKGFYEARQRLQGIAYHTPLQYMSGLSEKYDCNVFVKREDLQVVRSYKIRGAYNKMSTTPKDLLDKGVVCASAGNHAQGVAFSCSRLKVHCKIFMPAPTPAQKINKVKGFGREFVEIILIGKDFDEAFAAADSYSTKNKSTFVHPFNDLKVITGQGTTGLEIIEDIDLPIDFIFGAIGGGGFLSGVSSLFRQLSPETKIIGVEPAGAASMFTSFQKGKISQFQNMDPFVDGAAVGLPGTLTFDILRQTVHEILVIPEGKVCTTILELYNEEGIVTEPAGALTIASLDFYKE